MKMECTCEQCGAIFTVNPARANKRRFCSVECNLLYRKKHKREYTCLKCGEIYFLSDTHTNTYRCEACQVKHKADNYRGNTKFVKINKVTCKVCGRSRYVRESMLKNLRGSAWYCSQKCHDVSGLVRNGMKIRVTTAGET